MAARRQKGDASRVTRNGARAARISSIGTAVKMKRGPMNCPSCQ